MHVVLEDPFLRFWFRFVLPSSSFIARAGPRPAFVERVEPELAAYEGTCFERLCRQALPHLYRTEGVGADFDVGQYWDRRVQIDVVGLRDDHWTDLGECKWGTVRSANALRQELATKVAAFPNRRGATLCSRFFVRRRPPRLAPAPHERWHDLDALYDAAAG